jgi:AAA domain-containing protein/bifunctional DNA primase/polymerase-like protein
MSDLNQAQRQNLSVVDDAPPTQPQSMPEAPTPQDVQGAEALLLLLAGDQAVHELYSHFEVKSADDLAETDWSEFIRLAKMSCEDHARVLGSKQTAPSGPYELRLRLLNNGFAPLPAAGKAIYLEGWQTANITPEAIVSWERGRYQSHRNTGVRTKYTPAFDIDIKDQAAAGAVEAMVRDRFGGRGKVLLRIGMAPKRALLFRTETPFNKINRNLIAADGSTGQKFEFLGDGQQIVVDGIHPDTQRPYTWYGGTPWAVPASALPLITEAEARALVDDATALLVERFGYRHANPKCGTAGEGKNALDLDTLEANILHGIELHDSLRDLAWFLVLAGTPRDVAMRHLRTLMKASAAPRDDRWQDRYDSIRRLVDSAMKKAARPDAASEFEPVGLGDDAPSDGAPNSEPEPRLPFIIAAAWHGLPIPEREWVLRDRIPMRNVTLLAGDGGVGKTILHLQAGAAIALRRQWLGIPTEPGPVAVMCCEDDADELHRRIALIANHNQVGLSDLKDLHLLPLVDGHDTVLALPDSNGRIRPTKMFARLREAVCDIRPRLLTIDNLADVFGGNEINRVQVRQFMTLLRDLAIAAGGATLLTAHPSLTGMASGSGTSGSTGWHNSARARM